ncbi:hypothetical protein G6M89_11980 [Natronolimnobius sp. AArcel1]|uniref:DUF7344 domain-containing protein n=1 Tax=Natronolimnobius sp. AArcel1 TaxID=1679093 RepID=UPI0013EC3606|nr:hypothetical protein [Natronolimnobius sp. AArcel1]NGM69718.1 hypothetical protein [Natronolimnobius sp. AArcel1]
MTATSDSTVDCAETVVSILEWLEQSDESPGAVDEALGILSNSRRRRFIEVMRTYDEEITLPDAAEEVAVRESGSSVQELSADQVANVYLSLYHDHLPRLVDAGVLEYDQERDLVWPTAF